MEILYIEDVDIKSQVCENILYQLPDWFGNKQAILDYIEAVKDMIFYAYYEKNEPIAFIALKIHNEFMAEISVMGVLEPFHRKGLGKKLINECEKYCRKNNFEFLTVKTLADTNPDESYAKTRAFYQAMNFKPLEIFPQIWDENNPCLYMIKILYF